METTGTAQVANSAAHFSTLTLSFAAYLVTTTRNAIPILNLMELTERDCFMTRFPHMLKRSIQLHIPAEIIGIQQTITCFNN